MKYVCNFMPQFSSYPPFLIFHDFLEQRTSLLFCGFQCSVISNKISKLSIRSEVFVFKIKSLLGAYKEASHII